MASRNNILNSSVQPLDQGSYSQSESPTLSAYRARWANLVPWDGLETDVALYLQSLGVAELSAIVVPPHYTAHQASILALLPLPTAEAELQAPLNTLFWHPHNLMANPLGAAHIHAQIVIYTGRYSFFGDPDFLFTMNGAPVGIIELKTFWKVTAEKIDDVFYGTLSLPLSC
jgi:hypothetical protein